jgi:hypothetical protein
LFSELPIDLRLVRQDALLIGEDRRLVSLTFVKAVQMKTCVRHGAIDRRNGSACSCSARIGTGSKELGFCDSTFRKNGQIMLAISMMF